MQCDVVPTKTKYGYKVTIRCVDCKEGKTFDILIDTIYDVGDWIDTHVDTFHTKKDVCVVCKGEKVDPRCRWCATKK